MSGYGMDDTDLVYNQGSNIHKMGDPAFTTANSAAQAIIGSADIVHHHLLKGPLESLGLDCVDDANSLMFAVEGCGSGIAGSSVVVTDAENEQTGIHLTSATTAEQTRSVLERPLEA
jgi:hypothetical protein